MPLDLTGKTILVVDDDPDIQMAIKTGLADTGATLKSASDGNTAVSIIENEQPNLVILDIMLPQKSGFLVLEQLRKKIPKSQGPKFIMITGNQGQRHRQLAQVLGVDEYLNKPFRMDRLLELVEKVFAK